MFDCGRQKRGKFHKLLNTQVLSLIGRLLCLMSQRFVLWNKNICLVPRPPPVFVLQQSQEAKRWENAEKVELNAKSKTQERAGNEAIKISSNTVVAK